MAGDPPDGKPEPEKRERRLKKHERELLARRRRKWFLQGSAVVLAIIAVVAFVSVTYAPAVNTALHQHPNLQIFLSGQAYEIPPDIGINASHYADHSFDAYAEMGGMAPIHTHDSSGVIHLEMSRWHPFTLADLSRLRVEGEAHEADAGAIALGAPVRISAEGYPGQSWPGRVEEIPDSVTLRRLKPQDPSRPTDTRILAVKVAFVEPNPLKLGTTVELRIHPAGR